MHMHIFVIFLGGRHTLLCALGRNEEIDAREKTIFKNYNVNFLNVCKWC